MILVASLGVGLCLGSFANVLIARVPEGEDWVRGPSRCPKCRHRLAWHDNIPLLSWLWLRRRCRYCGRPISARYPVVESLVAGLVVASYLLFGLSLLAVAFVYLGVVSVALVFIDIDVQRLPNSLVLPSYPVVAALLVADAAVGNDWGALGRSGAGLGILGGFYGLLWLAYPTGLGFGDVRTAGLLGIAVGYLGWDSLAVGAIAGPIAGGLVVLVGLAIGRVHRKSRIPYGPALIGGMWLGAIAGQAIADWYVGLIALG